MIDLPLFPLSTVLFPRGTLPLHIFEERYKLMIGRCIAERSPFGVVLIRSGPEVGAAAEPYQVGTTARIARVQYLPDERLNIVAVGGERFRIDELLQRQPFARARVELLPDVDAETSESHQRAASVARQYAEYYRLVLALTDQWQPNVSVPQSPAELADYVAGRIDVEPRVKQQLLEFLSVSERLRHEDELLAMAIAALATRLTAVRRQRYGGLGAMN